jgi:hypothetical protein
MTNLPPTISKTRRLCGTEAEPFRATDFLTMKITDILFCAAALHAGLAPTAAATASSTSPQGSNSSQPPATTDLESKLVGRWVSERPTKRGQVRATIEMRADHTFSGTVAAETPLGRMKSTFEGRWHLEENGQVLVREYTKFDGPARQMDGRSQRLTIVSVTDREIRFRNPQGNEIGERRAAP